MLELKDIFFTIQKGREDIDLLSEVSLQVPTGHFMAIVGPSGCGKSTLLKLIAGINQETQGEITWFGQDLSEEDFEETEIGYVPQFSIAYDDLTVEESVKSAVRLRAKTRGLTAFHKLVDRILDVTGLSPIRDRQVKVLSGGQKRRLGLALELVSDPVLLLCDEVTSGLDPKSEQEIVQLMYELSRQQHRIVINVTHSLANLELYDSVLVLHEGRVVYHGPPRALEHYFSVKEAEDIYPQLARRTSQEWHNSWTKHSKDYYDAFPPSAALDPETMLSAELPSAMTQFFTLLARRFTLFFRDWGQIILQVAILVGFPILVVIFDMDGVEQTHSLSDLVPSTKQQFEAEKEAISYNMNLGGLVSGLIMFQVILLTLMGSNNSAREIAGERQIFEKEKLGGLRPGAYMASKIAFLSLLVIVQSLWMTVFVQSICRIPTESAFAHFAFLFLVNAAMTAICLGISSLARTADQASLLSIYLVGFQLPLSGAILALPNWAGWLTRPFISAYWSWAGAVDHLQSGYQRWVDEVTDTWLAPGMLCLAILVIHVIVGVVLAYLGVKKPRWEA